MLPYNSLFYILILSTIVYRPNFSCEGNHPGMHWLLAVVCACLFGPQPRTPSGCQKKDLVLKTLEMCTKSSCAGSTGTFPFTHIILLSRRNSPREWGHHKPKSNTDDVPSDTTWFFLCCDAFHSW